MRNEYILSLSSLNRFFNAHEQRSWTKSELTRAFEHMREEWAPTHLISTKAFIVFLLANTEMEEVVLKYATFVYRRYWWGEPDSYEVASSLTPKVYLSHHSAMHIHGLTDAKPGCVYGNQEQVSDGKTTGGLEQGRIEAAFRGSPRTTQNVDLYKGIEIYLLSGKNTRNLGVVEMKLAQRDSTVRVTNLERTLIDATVRPVYSGGVTGVLRAYKRAAMKVSIDALVNTLEKIAHKYPYHQSIGFYMDRAGFYDPSWLRRIAGLGLNYDFYLDYKMSDATYSKKWRVYYPKSLDNVAVDASEGSLL